MTKDSKTSFFSKQSSLHLFYIPAMLLFICFTLVPLIWGLGLSFTDWDGYTAGKHFVAFQNYTDLFKDQYFIEVLTNTLIFGFGCTILQQLFGLILALVLDSKLPGKAVFRAIIYLPVLVSPVIMGIMYYLMLQYNYGALNDIVVLLGHEKVAWLSAKNTALMWIVIINTIQFMGISMILYLTGLQRIPKTYHEAASIDGASSFQKFRHITLPMLYPAFVTSITINLIGGLKLFDIIKVLTNGKPAYSTNSISTYIGITYQNQQRAGYASAMGLILFMMIMVFTLVLNGLMKKKEVDA